MNHESSVLRACLGYLRAKCHFVFRVNGGAFQTAQGGWVRCTDTPGVADIVGVSKDGKALAVECKSSVGRQSMPQRAFEKAWKEKGGLYVLARGIEDLQEAGL